jgi:hypothetical protein
MIDQKKFLPIPKWHAPTDPKQVLPRLLATCGRRKLISRVLGTLPSGDDIKARATRFARRTGCRWFSWRRARWSARYPTSA